MHVSLTTIGAKSSGLILWIQCLFFRFHYWRCSFLLKASKLHINTHRNYVGNNKSVKHILHLNSSKLPPSIKNILVEYAFLCCTIAHISHISHISGLSWTPLYFAHCTHQVFQANSILLFPYEAKLPETTAVFPPQALITRHLSYC